MAAPTTSTFSLAVRGALGVSLVDGPPSYAPRTGFPGSASPNCKVMTFSPDGTLFAYADGNHVNIVSVPENKVLHQINKPRAAFLHFSPQNSVLATWEPYFVLKDQTGASPNLELYNVATAKLVGAFIQKKHAKWCPQWTYDEAICAISANSEVHFYENNNFDIIANKLHIQKVSEFSLPSKSGKPYHVAAYVPGSKGQPSFVRVYPYPNFGGPGSAVGNKSFYNADSVSFYWNNRGSAVLVLAATESSVDSYYGDQGLHYIDTKGESCLIPRAKNGPVYCVEWNPNSSHFCVVYGFMPAKATLYNMKCEPIFDFGTGPRNVVYYNPHGNILCLAGFGNLRGNMEFWDVHGQKLIKQVQAVDTTYFEWAPDGAHIATATTAPRLRVGNGYKVWHYTGSLLHETLTPGGQELLEVTWQRAKDGVYPEPQISYRAVQTSQKQPEAKAGAYVPPALRGQPGAKPKSTIKEAYEPASNMKQAQDTGAEMSKAALKNKKKKEAKARAKLAEEEAGMNTQPEPIYQQQPQQTQPQLMGTGDAELDKKIKNLRKKLNQLQKLKDQQAAGKQLEKNQLEKLSTEPSLLQELESLTLG